MRDQSVLFTRSRVGTETAPLTESATSSLTAAGRGDVAGVRSPPPRRWMRPLVMPSTESTMTASMPSATWYYIDKMVRWLLGFPGNEKWNTYVDVVAVIVECSVRDTHKTGLLDNTD